MKYWCKALKRYLWPVPDTLLTHAILPHGCKAVSIFTLSVCWVIMNVIVKDWKWTAWAGPGTWPTTCNSSSSHQSSSTCSGRKAHSNPLSKRTYKESWENSFKLSTPKLTKKGFGPDEFKYEKVDVFNWMTSVKRVYTICQRILVHFYIKWVSI